ncbi:MAG: right-handed parallel beta-helix repeat-containing protein [Lutimonas sp.]
MLRVTVLMLFICSLLTVACEDEILETRPSTGQLEFSKDTVFLDTVFTNISTSTRTFKVYNRSSENINLPTIGLARGESSFYRLNVNGIPGKSFENVPILARDSIFIFIEATIDYNAVSDPLYIDQIVFDQGPNEQEVELVTLVQDAYFLFPERDSNGIKETIVIGVNDEGEEIEVEGFYLDGSPEWTDEKPYVIYGFAGLSSGNTLTIGKGASIYFHNNSGLVVERGASLKVEGTLESKVSFQGDRLESFFDDIPGQWSGILLREGSRDHAISHATIKNSTVGLVVDAVESNSGDPALQIGDLEIYNTSSFGIFARQTEILGSNLVIGNNGSASLALSEGGSYRFAHSTFANFWSDGIRILPAVLISNVSESGQGEAGLRATFENCIIEGNQGIEFLLEQDPGSQFEFSFANSFLRFEDPGGIFQDDPLYDFTNDELYRNNVYNGNADFLDAQLNDLRIGDESQARGIGNILVADEFPFDLLGVDRRDSPDAGAYQHVLIEE